jgi:hypothetical protein
MTVLFLTIIIRETVNVYIYRLGPICEEIQDVKMLTLSGVVCCVSFINATGVGAGVRGQ